MMSARGFTAKYSSGRSVLPVGALIERGDVDLHRPFLSPPPGSSNTAGKAASFGGIFTASRTRT